MSPLLRELNTSVIVRLLTRDPIHLFEGASEILDHWKEGMPGFIVTDLVLSETTMHGSIATVFPRRMR